MSEPTVTCPNASAHGNPFRYCACGWMEDRLDGRNAATVNVAQFFEFDHLPFDLREVSVDCSRLAHAMIARLPDSPELTVGLRKLLEAKDCFVRAAVAARPEG